MLAYTVNETASFTFACAVINWHYKNQIDPTAHVTLSASSGHDDLIGDLVIK
jgi:hypothetical protein